MFKGETTTMTPPVTEETYTNPLGYAALDADKFQPVGDFILVQWQQAHDDFKVGKLKLARPDTHKGQSYTGIILSVGQRVDESLKVGLRILFQQFSGFEKRFDPKYGRLAIIRESNAIAIVPPRVKIENMDGDFDYDN